VLLGGAATVGDGVGAIVPPPPPPPLPHPAKAIVASAAHTASFIANSFRKEVPASPFAKNVRVSPLDYLEVIKLIFDATICSSFGRYFSLCRPSIQCGHPVEDVLRERL
jgi:hypothetical protein